MSYEVRSESRCPSRRPWAHLLSWKHPNHNQLLNNYQQNRLETTKKDIAHPNQRSSHTEMVRGPLLWYKQIPHPPCGRPTDRKISRLSHRSENSEPHVRVPSWGSGIGRRSPWSIRCWRSVGFECRGPTSLGEIDPLLEGAHESPLTLARLYVNNVTVVQCDQC